MRELSPWRIQRPSEAADVEYVYSTESEQVHLRDYWKMLLKHRRLVVLVFLAVLGLGAYLTFLVTPLYTASATLERMERRLDEMDKRFAVLEASFRKMFGIKGQPPDLSHEIVGCPYAPRCPKVQNRCRAERPKLMPVGRGEQGDTGTELEDVLHQLDVGLIVLDVEHRGGGPGLAVSTRAGKFLGIREMGGCCVFTMHPQIIGRPGRLAFLDAFIAFVTGHEDVWVTTTAEIAGRV